jgi:hypothetical protein
MRKIMLLGVGVCLLVSCVSTSAVKIGTGPDRPAVPWNKVAVYRSADQVPGKYEEVALLVSTADATWTAEAQMWESMQKKAGKMGANAIILDATSEPKAGTKVLATFLGVSADRKGKAIAIYVTPEEKK